MKHFAKYSFVILTLISFLTVIMSCNKDTNEVNTSINDDQYSLKSSLESEPFTVVRVTEDSTIVAGFIRTDFYESILVSTGESPQLSSSDKLVFEDTPLEILSIPLSETDSTYKTIYSVYSPDSNLYLGAFIVDVKERRLDSTTFIKYSYPNNEYAIRLKADNNNHIISVVSNPNPIYAPNGNFECITNCIENAMSACMADIWCMIECGLFFEWCIAAVTASCTYHCIWGTGVMGGGSATT